MPEGQKNSEEEQNKEMINQYFELHNEMYLSNKNNKKKNNNNFIPTAAILFALVTITVLDLA